MFEGVFTALIPPFRDGEVDGDALRALVDAQIEAGVDGVAPCGSTGEDRRTELSLKSGSRMKQGVSSVPTEH